jgi:hypothetical protein
VKEIPLTQSKTAIVDEADFERLNAFKWFAHKDRNTWYAVRWSGRRPNRIFIHMHRFILGVAAGVQVDHHNGDGLINVRSNLRIASNSQNQHNQRIRRDNTSGYKGVHRRKSGRWQAQLKGQGVYHYLGIFDSPADAARAYDNAARLHFGEFARLNFPERQI